MRVQFTGKKASSRNNLKHWVKWTLNSVKSSGAQIHAVREAINAALTARQTELQQAALAQKLASETVDITLPGRGQSIGSIHPVTQVQERICQFFTKAWFYRGNRPRS